VTFGPRARRVDAHGLGGGGDDRQVRANQRRHPAVAAPRRSPGGAAGSPGRSALETGYELPDTPLIELGEIRQKSGKLVLAWAARGDLDAATAVSNTYQMEWPPGSGRVETFPEIDRVEWFTLNQARRKLKAAQVPFLDRLQAAIAADR